MLACAFCKKMLDSKGLTGVDEMKSPFRIRHLPSPFLKKLRRLRLFNAFTLAEVLIVLGIIGIIADMTIPTLVSKTKEMQTIVKLKKSYSTWINLFSMVLATDGVQKLSDTTLLSALNGDTRDVDTTTFENELKKHLNTLKIERHSSFPGPGTLQTMDGNSSKGDSGLYIYTADGMMYYLLLNSAGFNNKTDAVCDKIKALGGSICRTMGSIEVFTNNSEGKHVYGRDHFSFNIGDNGMLYPSYGKDQAYLYNQVALSNNDAYWDSSSADK